MPRCKNDALLNKIGVKKLGKLTEVDFSVLSDADSCIKINAKSYLSLTSAGDETSAITSSAFQRLKVPQDMFSCLPEGCKNTGTLVMTTTGGTYAGANFVIKEDATDFYAGVMTYYVWVQDPGTYRVRTAMKGLKNTDSDIYYTEVQSALGEEFLPVLVDFSKVPNSNTGNGWFAEVEGAQVEAYVHKMDDGEEAVPYSFGLSSFYVYESLEMLEVNDVVKIGCLDDFSGDITIDAADASCFGSGYDPSSISIERTLTGKAATPNYWKLNPLEQRGDKTDGYFIHTVEREVRSIEAFGEFGVIHLGDMFVEECGFTTAQLSDDCNVTQSELNRVNSPIPIELDENQFIVLDGRFTETGHAGMILVHKDLIGEHIIVSYPKQADVEHFVGNENDLEYRRVRMSFSKMHTDKTRVVYVYNNVLITSFPETVNNEEGSFNFNISIQRDQNGNFYEKFRITE